MSDEFKNEMEEITQDDKLWAALSLAVPIIGIIVLFLEDKKARPHIVHGAVHAIALGIFGMILWRLPLIWRLSPLLWIYHLYLAYQAFNGIKADVPGLTDFLKGQSWI